MILYYTMIRRFVEHKWEHILSETQSGNDNYFLSMYIESLMLHSSY